MTDLGQQGLQTLSIPTDATGVLEVELCLVVGARRVVLFASLIEAEAAQYRRLARVFQRSGFATLVFDLSHAPPATLGRHLLAVSEWAAHNPRTHHLEQAFFGGQSIAQIARRAAQLR